MTMPRKSRRLEVDGQEYRWMVSRNVLRVEDAGSPGRLASEVLAPGEVVGPGRVAAMIRHARGQGWRPREGSAGYEVPDTAPLAQAVGRDAYLWVRSIRRYLGCFEACVGTPVELGRYWWEANPDGTGGGLGGRIRWGRSPTFPEADHFEGAFGIRGSLGEMSYSSVSAFPFRDGRLLAYRDEADLLFVLEQAEEGERFEARGWVGWDGPGEWSYVQAPGDLFGEHPGLAEERWVTVALPADSFRGPTDVHLHAVSSEARGPLVTAQGRPWVQDASVVVVPEGTTVRIDVTRLSIPGGWAPGRYRVALRISGLVFGEGDDSQITRPMDISIAR